MSKRQFEKPPADQRPTKIQTPLLTFANVALLPTDMDAINNAILARVVAQFKLVVGEDRKWNDHYVYAILSVIATICEDIIRKDIPLVEVVNLLPPNSDELVKEFKSAWTNGDFSRILLIERFRLTPPVKSTSVPAVLMATVETGWKRPFVGTEHQLLLRNIGVMHREKKTSASDSYMNHASIIQSSGSGKSRLVDEVAKDLFTIPLNIRDKGDTAVGAYPFPDDGVRELFVSNGKGYVVESIERRYLCILTELFLCTSDTLKIQFKNPFDDRLGLARQWYQHLADPENRKALYKDVLDKATQRIEDLYNVEKITPPTGPLANALSQTQEYNAAGALKALIDTILGLVSLTPNDDVSQVFLYFDEAHVLSESVISNSDKLPLDVLVSKLNVFHKQSLFVVFLSTQSTLEYLAPSSSLARSARYLKVIMNLHAPITETPFDCFGSLCIQPSRVTVAMVSDVVYMALFGRPLWRGLLSDFTQSVERDVTLSAAAPTVAPLQGREAACDHVLDYARGKLLWAKNVDASRKQFVPAAQTAVLDVRIMLSFEPNRKSTLKLEWDLVSSHMRTVFSIPKTREYLRSGYPPEPILAEAATRQLHFWRTHNESSLDPALEILTNNLSDNLLSRGEIGEATGRLLLMLARDRASVRMHKSDPNGNIHFSKAVSVISFIEELLPEEIATAFLDSRPDNMPAGDTLRDALKDACMNFTHFTKWADDSAPTQNSAFVAFLRGMAIICRNNKDSVDAFVPFLLYGVGKIVLKAMSGILVQFKLRSKADTCASAEIRQEDVGMFPRGTEYKGKKPFYITIVMELGITDSLAACKKTAVRAVIQSPLKSRRTFIGHPRYSIYIYGCSPEVYKVIKEEERALYHKLLRSGELLAEHPRQDVDYLDAVRRQKPFFSVGSGSFHWVKDEKLNPARSSNTQASDPPEYSIGPTHDDGEKVVVGHEESVGAPRADSPMLEG